MLRSCHGTHVERKKARKSTTQRLRIQTRCGRRIEVITYMQQNKLGRTSAAEGYENV